MSPPTTLHRGEPWPLGASVRDGGVNFALYAPEATGVELVLFDDLEDEAPTQVVDLRTRHQRSGRIWHVFVEGIGAGTLYGWRVHGPHDPDDFRHFDGQKLLVDPYARAVRANRRWSRRAAMASGDNTGSALRSMVVDQTGFDWHGTGHPRIRPTQRILYELHVRGFTVHPTSGVREPGTFAGLIDKVPYIRDLGVTTVELLPVFEFDATAPALFNPLTGEPLRDFWGYNPVTFFAAHHAYEGDHEADIAHGTSFRKLVRAFHEAGIEVILDVVFNHTGEGGRDGPFISFRGLDNPTYYMEDPRRPGQFANYSGCGNTVNCNHPVVRRMILDSLRYWVDTMGVDGFRFDLASIFSRGPDGDPLENPPLTWEIESDPTLQGRLLIAEAWDAAGLFQVGTFPGERWAEWNGRFRDDVRRFWRGDHGMAGPLATRMMGSPDIYQTRGRQPAQGINFITCHDGFTLNDLVSWREKHNLENGENNRDGSSDNLSWNHGFEGNENVPASIDAARERDIRNLLATLMLAQGTPMLLAGDEFRRTQNGNNNAWCQDNETSWVDWSLLERHADLHRFTRLLIRFRQAHPSVHRARFLLGEEAEAGLDPWGYTRVAWHGLSPRKPDWSNDSQLVVFTLTAAMDDCAHCIILHAGERDVTLTLPPVPGEGEDTRWHRAIDTSRPSPEDIHEPGREPRIQGSTLTVPARSVLALTAPDNRTLQPGLTGRMFSVAPRHATDRSD
ncbi:MAG: glycogen debranching enzyme GlgX [Deltaproteobacteria bacterium]|nr:MAG: glycogen debranching enzyme GlgX [Deltaproteobacteria bacterium]